ncbi:ATPase, T2SS/T4P/T4SS family [Promicromonospora aerolata]|uniref:ATPase, T2SS/T4P/T4SS family n=1 Tax=Promicromonospora aerolata TaxID=195749 RepID=A0ABW4VC96_9MICO
MTPPEFPDLSSLPIFHDADDEPRALPRRTRPTDGAPGQGGHSAPARSRAVPVEQTNGRRQGAASGPATVNGGAPPSSGNGTSPWVGAVARAGREYHGQPGNPRLRDSEFWRQVNSLRGEVSARLTTALATRELDEEQREALGQELIQQVVRDHNDALLSGGQRNWTPEYQVEVTRALFDALFRLGRLQPLIDTPDVENIEITGTAPVLLLMGDGRRTYAEPIADSDAELIDFLQFLAARDPANERSFTRANPFLNLDLPGRVRLAAVGWVVPWPRVTIRLQRLQSVDLELLRRNSTVDTVLAEFLNAAVRARKSIVVSGQGQGSGKALALETEVPTPSGWTTMGALNAGDQVFAEDGTPCTVLAAHDYQYDRACYEVELDDGTVITADADHLWRVSRRTLRQAHQKANLARRKDPAHYVDEAERARLRALAERASQDEDRLVTVPEFSQEAGAQHRDIIQREANRLGPAGHTYVSWVRHDGLRGGRPMKAYSRQDLAKALSVARDTPTKGANRRAPETVVMTTQEMVDSGLWSHSEAKWKTRDFAINLTKPIQYERTDQPINPYVLGVWLGDGATATARIATADPEVLSEFAHAGYPCTKVGRTKYDYGVAGNLQSKLRHQRLIGDKHIPAIYLRGDVDQRLALLQGLMDSDGTCTKTGTCEFSSTLQVLAEQVRELTAGLGYKPHMRKKDVIFKGQFVGHSWTVSWTTHDPMFRLPRKLERQALGKRGGPEWRYVVDIRPVRSVPVRCITVDSPSSLYLVTRQFVATHNTTLLRALCAGLDSWESIATIETDYELYLHLEPEKHKRVVALRTREGSGEMNATGRRVGEINTNVNVYESLRHNISRVIVGEVRGPEIVSMFQAMQMGNGSLSTVHADGARDVVERLVGMAVQDSTLSETYAYRQVAQSVDLIVFLRVDAAGDGRRHRYVSEVIEVTRGEAGNPVAITDVFEPGTNGRAVPKTTPSFLADLEAVGFDANLLNYRDGLWGTA